MFHMTLNNHSGWKLLKACRKCIFFQSICTRYMYVSICFEFDKVVFFSLTSFAYKCEEEKKKERRKKEKKVMSSTSNVYMN